MLLLHNLVTFSPGFDTVDGHDNVLCAWICGVEAEYMEQLSDEEIEEVFNILKGFQTSYLV